MMNVSFTGDVIPAKCECHNGQFVGRVFMIEKGKEIELAHTFFESEATANKCLDSFVFAVAEDALKRMGLSIDQARTVTVERGEKADLASQKAINESKPYLH